MNVLDITYIKQKIGKITWLVFETTLYHILFQQLELSIGINSINDLSY